MNHKTIVIASALGIGVCVVAYGLTQGIMNRPVTGSRTAVRSNRSIPSSSLVQISDNNSKKPLSQYLTGREAGLFEVPGASADMEEDPFGLDEMLDETPEEAPAPSLPPSAPDPLVDYVYAGTVSIDGRYAALLENRKTKEGHFLQEGDRFLDGIVGSITDRNISISMAGSPRQLAKTEDYRLTPLNNNAPFLATGTPDGTAVVSNPSNIPGMPGGPPGAMPGMPGGFPGRPGGFGGGGMMGGGMRFGGGPGGSPMTFQMSPGGGSAQSVVIDGGMATFDLAVPAEASPARIESIQIVK